MAGLDLDPATRALLTYAKLTETPRLIEATALISFFDFTGRMEAAAGLPMDDIPAGARPPEVAARR